MLGLGLGIDSAVVVGLPVSLIDDFGDATQWLTSGNWSVNEGLKQATVTIFFDNQDLRTDMLEPVEHGATYELTITKSAGGADLTAYVGVTAGGAGGETITTGVQVIEITGGTDNDIFTIRAPNGGDCTVSEISLIKL